MASQPKKRTGKSVLTLRVMQHPHAEGLPLPEYQTEGAAGFDLVAALPANRPMRLKARMFAMIPTGLTFEIPVGYEAQVRPRSGLAAKEGVTVLNAPGTIDSDYRGEVKVILINHGPRSVKIERGMRIAQMIIAAVTQASLVPTTNVSQTVRGSGGFGSTGVAPTKAVQPKIKSVTAKVFPRRRVGPARPGRAEGKR